MRIIAGAMHRHGYTLRSGGAKGADYAFELGCDRVRGGREIFVPWDGFENRRMEYGIPDKAFELAGLVHPAWEKLSEGARKLHARNCMQVLGPNLDDPSRMVICWTDGGKMVGGTRTALKLAEDRKIPIHNLAVLKISELEEQLGFRVAA